MSIYRRYVGNKKINEEDEQHPHPAEGGVWILFILFVNFLVSYIPSIYGHVYIYIYIYIMNIIFMLSP